MNPEPHFLGVDLGTSSLKCGLFDANGHRVGAARAPYSTNYSNGGAEQDADDWWDALSQGLARVVPEASTRKITAIAVGGHAPSPVFVDSNLQSVAPVLTWLDHRSALQLGRLIETLGRQPTNGPERLMTQVAARAMWLRDTASEKFARVDCILHSGDYLVTRLTRKRISTSPKMPEILTAAKLPFHHFPEMELQAGNVVAGMTAEVARQFGFEPEVPVIAAGLDSFMASIGSGIREPGDACLSTGSSAGVALVGPATCAGRFRWCDNPVISKPVRLGGRILEWVHGLASPDAKLPDLLVSAGQLRNPLQTHRFLPELIEEGNGADQCVRALISRMAGHYDAVEILRLLLDAIFLVQRKVLDELEMQGGAVRRVRAVGALAAYAELNQLQADIMGRTVEIPRTIESGTLGAAMLAAVATGFGTQREVAVRMVQVDQVYHPRDDVANYYHRLADPDVRQQGRVDIVRS